MEIKNMKTLKLFWTILGIGLCSLTFYSCLDDDDINAPSLDKQWLEIITVVLDGENSYYLRRDDGSLLWPINNHNNGYHPEAQVRALVNYTVLGSEADESGYYVAINSVDEKLTKAIAEDRGLENDGFYGTDPVSIAKQPNSGKDYIWIGDDYLNIYFEAYFGGMEKHFVNLVNTNPENPYELEFRHNAYDDPKSYINIGFVAFDLRTLPPTEDGTIDLVIKVKTFDGDKTYNIEYHPNDNERMNNTKAFNGLVMDGLK